MSATDMIQLVPMLPLDFGTSSALYSLLFTDGLIIAKVQNVDILANIQAGWTDFLHSGKAGASVVGLVFGYMIRGMTK